MKRIIVVVVGSRLVLLGRVRHKDNTTSAPESTSTKPVAATDTTTAASSTVPTRAVPTTLAAPARSAAPGVSPYVKGFGNLTGLSLPAGDPDAVSIIASSPRASTAAVRWTSSCGTTPASPSARSTSRPARDEAGKLVGSGDSQASLQPRASHPVRSRLATCISKRTAQPGRRSSSPTTSSLTPLGPTSFR